ncbi:uncharacterized protein LOC131619404 [Vicia villosa]|uniref:uncharacterized protein LOC131619404 n=1 Tax=Vicia villosa TaxID=3911 RepID=UPI00273CAE3D|nr:uncharacterized protein LOC131619404 [Vicia villosa]
MTKKKGAEEEEEIANEDVEELFVEALRKISNTFKEYAAISGQHVNCGKSYIFGGAMYASRLNILVALANFNIGSNPLNYLGVLLLKDKPKKVFLQPITDKVIIKLAMRKGSLLSFAGRVELVKSYIQGMLSHSMVIYAWPLSLIRDLERAIKRFLWSGDTSKQKVVTVG